MNKTLDGFHLMRENQGFRASFISPPARSTSPNQRSAEKRGMSAADTGLVGPAAGLRPGPRPWPQAASALCRKRTVVGILRWKRTTENVSEPSCPQHSRGAQMHPQKSADRGTYMEVPEPQPRPLPAT